MGWLGRLTGKAGSNKERKDTHGLTEQRATAIAHYDRDLWQDG